MSRHTLSPIPPAVCEHRLITLSAANTWEVARAEWGFTGISVEDTEETFPGGCQLCGNVQTRTVYEIKNKYTKNNLLVGNDCVARFVSLDGAIVSNTDFDIKANRKLFSQQLKRQKMEEDLEALFAVMLHTQLPFDSNLTRKFTRIVDALYNSKCMDDLGIYTFLTDLPVKQYKREATQLTPTDLDSRLRLHKQGQEIGAGFLCILLLRYPSRITDQHTVKRERYTGYKQPPAYKPRIQTPRNNYVGTQ